MCYTRIHERTKGVYMKNRKVFTLLLTGMLTLSMGSTVYASGTDAAIAEAQAEKQAAEEGLAQVQSSIGTLESKKQELESYLADLNAQYEDLMSPDDHFQDMKRVIAAVGGKARRVNVIMPYLYESRQDKRVGRESLDCANALHELIDMGVENIITFDAHDSRVQNATPLHGFETVQPSYQFIKALLNNEKGLHIDKDHFMTISPDEGSMNRAIYLANVLGVDMGMYYKRLDYSRYVNGRHPIAAYEFLGPKIEGKDMILIDDMISSGDTIIKIASLLKEKGAGRVYICSTFGFFTDGLDKFDDAYKKGYFDKLLTTNLVYQSPELLEKPYYISCDMSKYIALIIDTLNHDTSVSHLLNPVDRIKRCVTNYMSQHEK